MTPELKQLLTEQVRPEILQQVIDTGRNNAVNFLNREITKLNQTK